MAEFINCHEVLMATVPTGETWKAGEFRLVPDGRVGVVRTGPDALEGEKVALRVRGVFRHKAGAAFVAGATGSVVIATQVLEAAGSGVDCCTILADVAINGDAMIELNP